MLRHNALRDILKLQIPDYLLMQQLRDPAAKAAFLTESQRDINRVEMLIRIANVDPKLEILFKDPAFDNDWNSAYDTLTFLLARDSEAEMSYAYSQPTFPYFDLVRGLYFFYRAQQIFNDMKKQTTAELLLLREAMKYHSIHAMQRHHQLLYQEARRKPVNASEILSEIIQNCKSMLPFYGSFAHVMLTEAYCHYACCLSKNNKPLEATFYYRAALASCNDAEEALNESEGLTHNASFGQGLKRSNSLALETVDELKQYIKEKVYPLIFNSLAFSPKNHKPSLVESPTEKSSLEASKTAARPGR